MINFVNKDKGNLSKILLKEYPMLSYSELKVLFRKKDIKINGKRVNSDVKLVGGEEIIVYNKDKELKVVYEDNNVYIVHKPIGVECKKEDRTYAQNSLEEITNYYVCHRLDMNTEGLIIMAKNEHIRDIMFDEFKKGNIHKFYIALVKGVLKKDSDTMSDYLVKGDDRVYVSHEKVKDSQNIITKYKVLKRFEDVSMVEVELLTGRTHQIRAHFAYISHPVVGDNKYGDKEFNESKGFKKQCLCAYKLRFTCENFELKYLNELEFETKPTFNMGKIN